MLQCDWINFFSVFIWIKNDYYKQMNISGSGSII